MSDSPFSGGKNKSSQFDPGGVIKNVHDLHAQALRTLDSLSVVSGYWSHFNVAYNFQNKPTDVSYYRGLTPNKVAVTCSPDVSGSLQNKYFHISSGYDNQKYHIWLNVDSLGIDPAPLNSIGIEVSIDSNDPAVIVAKAIQLTINNLFSSKFSAAVVGSIVTIQNQSYGQFDPGVDVNTSFVILSETGINEIVTEITIAYDIDGNPLYQGQVLKNYYYDIYSGKFLRSAAVDVENLSVSVDLDGFSPLDPDSVMVTGSENGLGTGTKHGLKIDALNDAAVFDSRVRAELQTANGLLTDIKDAVETPPGISVDLDGFDAVDPDSVQQTGSADGTATGTKYGIVYNRRQQILDSHDRIANFSYADFGTKFQRITKIEYTSSTFPGITITRDFTYTLVSGQYRRDSEIWDEI
jgi:hypothetical protein